MFWGEINLFLHLILSTFSFRLNGGGRPFGPPPSSCSRPPCCFEAWKTWPCRLETWADWRPSNFPLQLWRHAWIYSRLGILFTVKLLQFCFPGRGHQQRLANFQGQTSFRVTPRQAYFVCFPAKMTKFYFSRFHVAGAVGSFICDVSFRHQSHERSQLIFCCDMYTLGGCPSLIKDQTKHW